MSATEALRRMLDERGVEWANPNSCLRDEKTNWVANGFDYEALEDPYGTLILSAMHQDSLTPEQAVAATVRRGTCHATSNPPVPKHWTGCSNCGSVWDFFYNICGYMGPPNFCPKCGAKVVDA